MRNKAAIAIVLSVTVQLLAQGDYQKAVSFYKQGQYSEAIEEFQAIIKGNPDYETGHRILGDAYLRTKNYEKAVEAFKESLRLKKDNFFSHYGLALAYYNTGRYEDTIATLLRAESVAKSPRDRYQLYHIRGSAHFNTKKFRKAASDLKKATSIQRGNFTDLLQLGISSYQMGSYSDAEHYLKQALALDPQASEAKRYLSRLRYKNAIKAIEETDYKKATALLADYTRKNPGDGEGWFNLGLAQLFANHLLASEQAFQKSLELLPENWQAYDRLGYIYEKEKNYRQALKKYQRARQLHPDPIIEESVKRIQERIRRLNSS